MATPSLEGYKTSLMASIGDEEAKQKVAMETPWYTGFNMFWNWGTQQTNPWMDEIKTSALNKQVEIWTWARLNTMSDEEKQNYVNGLSTEAYNQMKRYKDEWYSFEASKALLESELPNPNWKGLDKYQNKWGFLRNLIWWAWDSATWVWQFIWNSAADIIWWTAKKLWADEDRVDYLVNDFKNYLEDSKISKTVWANTDSLAYKWAKLIGDMWQVVAWEWLIRWAMEWTKVAGAIQWIKNAWLLGKAAVWAAEWAADMWLYSIVSDSELPSGWDLALWAAFWWILPIAWAWIKAWTKWIKEEAGRQAENLIEKINKMSPSKLQKFEDKFGENAGKVMNDRWLKTRQDANNWFIKSYNKVNEALDSIKWTFKAKEVDDVLAEAVEFATKTADKNVDRLLQLQEKAVNEWLTMSEINEVKRYFEAHTKFTYGKAWDAVKSQRATNLDTALREWQRKTAAENWLTNLEQLNKETQMAKEILNSSKDASEKLFGSIDPTDELLAIHYGWLDWALATYVTKSVLKSDIFKAKFVDILNRLNWHTTKEAIMADLEAISKANTEKEFKELMKKRELDPALPAPTEWWVNDAGKTILSNKEEMIWTPEWWTIVKDKVTEIPKRLDPAYANKLKTDLSKLTDEIVEWWWITYDMSKWVNYWWRPYVSVSPYPNRSAIIPLDQFNSKTLWDYILKNQDKLFEDGFVLWWWLNEWNMYLDVSIALPKKFQKEAIDIANKYNQKAIFDLENFEDINTMGDGSFVEVDEAEVEQFLKALLSKE